MKKVFLFSFLLLTFLISATCIYCVIVDEIYAFIVPAIISFIGVITISYLLIIETIVGHKLYYYINEVLYIKRKNKTISKIKKRAIKTVTLVCDTDVDDLYIVSFKYNGKKHYIAVNSHNKDNILDFIEGIEYDIKKNYWYYLIYLMEVLLI